MLKGLESFINIGAVQHLGAMVMDVMSAALHSVTKLLDLPVGVSSLESSIRFVKTSGFESGDSVPVVAAVGLTIGGGYKRPQSSNPSASSSSKSFPKGRIASESSSPAISTGFARVVPKAMLFFLIMDILSIVFARQAVLSACASKLGIVQWVIGGVLLGFPSTFIVESVRKECSFRSAFVTEMFLLFVSFLWLCYGGAMIFNAVNACVDSIAPLWWLSYVSSVLSLSVAGTVIFCMVVTTVLSLMYGSQQK